MIKNLILTLVMSVVVQSRIHGFTSPISIASIKGMFSQFKNSVTTTTNVVLPPIADLSQFEAYIPAGWVSTNANAFQEQNGRAVEIAQVAVQQIYAPQSYGNQYEGLPYVFTQQITGSTNEAMILQYGTSPSVYYMVFMNSSYNQILSIIDIGPVS